MVNFFENDKEFGVSFRSLVTLENAYMGLIMYSLETGPLLASFRRAIQFQPSHSLSPANPRGYLSPQILWRPTNPSTRPETRKRPELTRLEEVVVTTGEEDEDAVLDL